MTAPSGGESPETLDNKQLSATQQAKTRLRYTLPRSAMIGSYLIEKPLGHGGMGEVYLARHTKLDIYRAIKILLPKVAVKNPMFAKCFMQEARLAIKLQHPNIVNVMDADYDANYGIYYIVMEYVDGGTVRSTLKKSGAYSEKATLETALKVGEALTVADNMKIVHRDIKPDNIMIAADNSVKLADLGIAKSPSDALDEHIASTESLVGTPAYVSPEQAGNAQSVDCRADIYSLGVTLYEMLTAEKPYKGKSTLEILEQVFNADIPDIREKNGNVSDETALLIRRMMAKDRTARPRNWSALCDEVSGIMLQKGWRAEGLTTTVNINANYENQAPDGILMGHSRGNARKNTKIIKQAVAFFSILLLLTGAVIFLTSTRQGEAALNTVLLSVISSEHRNVFQEHNAQVPFVFPFRSKDWQKSWLETTFTAKKEHTGRIAAAGTEPKTAVTAKKTPVKFNFASNIQPNIEAWINTARPQVAVTIEAEDGTKEKLSAIPSVTYLAQGKYALKIEIDNCQTMTLEAEAVNEKPLIIDVKPSPLPATVKVVSGVKDFRLWDGSEWIGADTVKVPSLEKTEITVKADGYITVTKELTLEPGESREINVAMTPRKKSIAADSETMQNADKAFNAKEYATAKKYYAAEAEKENAEACYKMGLIYDEALGEWFADQKKAVRFYMTAAEQDHAPAIRKVASFYENGIGGLAMDSKKALEWYMRGAQLEDVECLNNAGRILESADAPEAAEKLYKRSAAKNDKKAKYALGELYRKKMMLESDPKTKIEIKHRAMEWYRLADTPEARIRMKEL